MVQLVFHLRRQLVVGGCHVWRVLSPRRYGGNSDITQKKKRELKERVFSMILDSCGNPNKLVSFDYIIIFPQKVLAEREKKPLGWYILV